jgi:predicted dehydrogenase
MNPEPLGIGVVGAGAILRRHALAYKALPDLARLVAISDLDEKRARSAKESFRFDEAVGDYSTLLSRNDIHVIDVCTPAGSHKKIVLDALAAGKHVLCEKPIATNLADADSIIHAAEKHADRTASCVFQLRTDPVHRRMRWMIEQGEIGRPLLARVAVRVRKSPGYYTNRPGSGSWKTDGGGVLINQAIHQLDALISFLGEPREICAVMDTFVHPIEAEDAITGWIRFESGALATIECTTCARKKEFLIDVVGENAQMRVTGDPDGQVFDWKVDASGSAARKAVLSAGLKAVPQPKKPNKHVERIQKLAAKIRRRPWIPPLTWGHTPLIREFLLAARESRPGPVPPAEARRSLALATAFYESAMTGRVVHWPIDSSSEFYHGFQPREKSTAGIKKERSADSATVSLTRGV